MLAVYGIGTNDDHARPFTPEHRGLIRLWVKDIVQASSLLVEIPLCATLLSQKFLRMSLTVEDTGQIRMGSSLSAWADRYEGSKSLHRVEDGDR